MLVELTLSEFAQRTADKDPVPGGGCVSALAASLAAALTEMVARFTIGRKGFEAREEQMRELAGRAAACRRQLLAAVDEDATAYGRVMAAYRLPKVSEEEKGARAAAVEAGLKEAARVPLAVAKVAREVLELAATAVAGGNPNTVTDGAVGALMARSAALGALLNVKVNLGAIGDLPFVSAMAAEVRCIEADILKREAEILAMVPL